VFQSVQGGAGYVTTGAAGNTGTGVFGAVDITNAADPNYGKDFQISFSGGNYTVTTKDVPPATVATGAFDPQAPIAFGGIQLQITGTPANGDTFDVSTAKNAGTDVFAAIGDLVAALKTPLTGGGVAAQSKLQNALSTANVKLSNAYDNVLTIHASVGSRLNELDALNTSGATSDVNDKSYLSSIQDLDMTSAVSQFAQQQTALQATQQTFAKLSSISLFNYLN